MPLQQAEDVPTYSIALRRTLMIACGVPLVAGFGLALLQRKGLINVEKLGVPEEYGYVGAFGAGFLGLISIFIVWRCPGCRAYLGKEGNPTNCPSCGAKFT